MSAAQALSVRRLAHWFDPGCWSPVSAPLLTVSQCITPAYGRLHRQWCTVVTWALIPSEPGLHISPQGRLQTALAYLDMAPGEGALDTAVLRDRIYRAGGPELAATAPAPPFPFVAEEVAASPGAQGRVSVTGAQRVSCPRQGLSSYHTVVRPALDTWVQLPAVATAPAQKPDTTR